MVGTVRFKVAWALGRLSYKIDKGPIEELAALRMVQSGPISPSPTECTCVAKGEWEVGMAVDIQCPKSDQHWQAAFPPSSPARGR